MAEYMIDSLVPWSTGDSKGFTQMMVITVPGHSVPCANTFSEKIIPKIYEEEKNQLKSILVEVHYPAITQYMWTSIATDSFSTDSFSTMTVH